MLTVEPTLIERYVATGRLRLVFRPVLNLGEGSLRAAEAAACAAEQGRFWPMHELLFERQDEVWAAGSADLPSLMRSYAAEVGLDTAAFDACVADGAALALVQALDEEQRQRGITVQPIFEIGERRLVGLQSLATFEALIQ